jgi:hypothetical protein
MPPDNPAKQRRWEREPAAIPISLVLEADHFKRDDSATAVDISLRGVGVRTSLALVPGEWVGVVVKEGFPHAIPTRVVWVREEAPAAWTFAGLEFLVASET